MKPETGKTGDCVGVFARSDYQSISGVPGCDQTPTRPHDPRTGLPVPVWELTCEAHEAWVLGANRPKVLVWEKDGNGGYRQERVSQIQDDWKLTVDEARDALVLRMLAQGMSYKDVVDAGVPGMANRGAVSKARRRALDAIKAPAVGVPG